MGGCTSSKSTALDRKIAVASGSEKAILTVVETMCSDHDSVYFGELFGFESYLRIGFGLPTDGLREGL